MIKSLATVKVIYPDYFGRVKGIRDKKGTKNQAAKPFHVEGFGGSGSTAKDKTTAAVTAPKGREQLKSTARNDMT